MSNLEMYLDQNSCYGELAMAIVRQACDDYLTASKGLYDIEKIKEGIGEGLRDRKSKDQIRFERYYDDTISFFRSEWYMQLCKIDGEVMLDILDKEVEKWRQEKYIDNLNAL